MINIQPIPPPRGSGRLREFDALRGFSMLTVVFIHCLGAMDLGYDKTLPGEIITTFFMPLFFFISGFFAFKDEDRWDFSYYKSFLANKIKALIICPIAFYALLHFVKNGNPIGWIHNGFGEYWFVIALFVMSVLYMSANALSRLIKRRISILAMLILAFTALAILASHIIPGNDKFFKVLEINNVCYFLQFFSLGILCSKYRANFSRAICSDMLFSICLIAYVLSLCCQHSELNSYLGGLTIINGFITTYLGTIIVVSLFLRYKERFYKDQFGAKWICGVGSRTLDIYMLHYFFIPSLIVLHNFLAPDNMIIFQLFLVGTLTFAIVQMSLYCSRLIRVSPTLANWLFGVRPKSGER